LITQSGDEVYLWNLDMYGPEFRHMHPEHEAREWFAALGFVDVVLRDRMAYGDGLTADLPA
jgi:hypothetical protein